MSAEFERVAADFFGGRAVLFDHEYQEKARENAWSPPHTKNYIITNDSFRLGDDLWNECNKTDSALCQFLKDCLKSNELETALVKGRKVFWLNNAQVDPSRVGPHSANIELKAFLNDLNPAGGMQSGMEEGDTSYALIVSSFFFAEEDSEAETKHAPEAGDNDNSSLEQTEPISDPKGKIKTQIDGKEASKVPQPDPKSDKQNGDEDWVKTGEDHKTDATNSSLKKKRTNGNNKKKKGNKKGKISIKKKPSEVSPMLESESEIESQMTEESKILAYNTVSQPLNSFKDPSLDESSGDWNVVQNKLLPRRGRSLNAWAGTSSGVMRSQAEVQSKPPVAAFDQVRCYLFP
jgi:hypothetical protein